MRYLLAVLSLLLLAARVPPSGTDTCDAQAVAAGVCPVAWSGDNVAGYCHAWTPTRAAEVRDALSRDWTPTIVCSQRYVSRGWCSAGQIGQTVAHPWGQEQWAARRLGLDLVRSSAKVSGIADLVSVAGIQAEPSTVALQRVPISGTDTCNAGQQAAGLCPASMDGQTYVALCLMIRAEDSDTNGTNDAAELRDAVCSAFGGPQQAAACEDFVIERMRFWARSTWQHAQVEDFLSTLPALEIDDATDN